MTIKLQFDNSITNGTLIEFNETYASSDIQLKSIQPSTTNTTGTVTGRVQQSVTGKNSTLRPQIQLTTTESVTNIQTVLTIQHPRVQNSTQYQVSIRPPGGDNGSRTKIASYRVRPVGDDSRSGLTGEFDRRDGSGLVYQDATVYQGESDIEFRGALEPPLRGVSGSAEGYLFAPPVPTDAPTGIYSSDGTNDTATVRVQTPEMNTLRVENTEGIDISGGTAYPETTKTLTVTAQSNFEDAEQIELTVRNDNDVDITEEIIDTARTRPETPDGDPPLRFAVQSNERENTKTQLTYRFLNADDTTSLEPSILNSRQSQSSSTVQPQSNDPSIRSASAPMPTQIIDSVSPERSLNQTEVDTGASVEVTVTGVVDNSGRISFEESFSPAITGAGADVEIDSVTSSSGSVSTITSGATENGIAVAAEASPGNSVTVTYTIQVGQSDATYRIGGSVTTGSETINYDDTGLTVGSGGNTEVTSNGKVSWELDLSEIDTQSLSISVSGSDDFTNEASTASTTVRISDTPASLQLGTSRPARGQDLELSVTNGAYGSTHIVIIPVSDLNPVLDVTEYDGVFRDVGTTRTTGIITQSGEQATGTPDKNANPIAVFARVQIDSDDGVGRTQLRTQLLADETTIELLDNPDPTSVTNTGRSIDTIQTSVVDASTTLTAPDTYATQSETMIKGDVTAGVDTVIMYVETDAGFEQIDLDDQSNGKITGTSVSGESFSHDVTLSRGDGPGNVILSRPGTYQVALRAKASVRSDYDGDIPTIISKPAMLSGKTSTQKLVVRDTAITLDRPGLDGAIATTEPSITLQGTVEGRENALIVAIGDRGAIETVQVEGPNFSDVEMSIDDFARGTVTVHAISAGRDGQVGDGNLDESRITKSSLSPLDRFARYLLAVADTGKTGKQLRSILLSETDLDTASDDPIVMRELLVTEPKVTINSPPRNQSITDDTIQARGTTNIRADNERIEIDLRKRGRVKADANVKNWDEASWNVTISIPDNVSGRHTLTADTENAPMSGKQIVIKRASQSTGGSTSITSTTTSSVLIKGNGDNQTGTETNQKEITPVVVDSTETPAETSGAETNASETVDVRTTHSTQKSNATASTPRALPGFTGSTVIIVFILILVCLRTQFRR
jgi:major cell surface glycoprotein (TIGR04216 family)